MNILEQLAEKFRSSNGPDYEYAADYLKLSREELIAQLDLNEGVFGEEVWAACETLKARGWETPLSQWLLSSRSTPCPMEVDSGSNEV